MARPRILTELSEKVEVSDDEVFDDTIPIDADTLGGYTPDHYASKDDVRQIMMTYMSTILGKSY